MKCNLPSASFGLFLFISTCQLYAQNGLPIARPTSLIVAKKGGTGLQGYHYFTSWRGLAFGPNNKTGYINPFGDVPKYGLFGGSYNTATGSGALASNTSGSANTADGYQTLYTNSSGGGNTAIGYEALTLNTTGINNTGCGYQTLTLNTTGVDNTAIGIVALYANTTGNSNTATGASSLGSNTTGIGNSGFGRASLNFNLTGNYLTAVGYSALYYGTGESYSVAVGYSALNVSNSSTGYNTAIGPNSMYANTSGYFNAASGALAMYDNTTGSYNTATGAGALFSNTSGSNNVAVGEYSLSTNTTGSNNTVLGISANVTSGALNYATALGANAQASASNSVVVGSTSVTSIGGYVGWTKFSDGRYKKNIQQNVPGLAFINKLNPVTYTLDITGIENKLHENQPTVADKNLSKSASYLNDPVVKQAMQEKSAISYSGFIAQDVEKAADSLGYNFSGVDKPKDANQSFYGLCYGDFVVPLVKAVQELSKINDSVNSKIDSLQAQINELRSMLLSKNPTTSTVLPGASLDQNVPNPTSNSTTIGYALPQGTEAAQMQITDMSGKILQIISLSGVGRNTITVDTSSFASGTYNYSLLINGQLAGTRKMVSIR